MTSPACALPEALACLDRGWSVTPLCWPDRQGRCACPKKHVNEKEIGKAPLLGTGYQDRLLSREEVVQCWTRYPRANYGILLKPSGLLVTDADSLDADREVEEHGVLPGPRVRTAGGVHRFFQNSSGVIGRTTKRGESHSLDVLSDGYVVGTGSLHRSGVRYAWEVTPEECSLEDPPTWAVNLLREAMAQRGKVEAGEIPDDLPPITLDTLRLPRWLASLIRCGPAVDPQRYPSRSEALFAALCGLIDHGQTDPGTLAAILLNPDYSISEKPREQGRRWLADEIARTRAKANSNGHAPDWSDVEGEAQGPEESDAAETARMTEQEREESVGPPDCAWRRIFAEVATIVKEKSWGVWLATYSALGALAFCNLKSFYYRPVYGMVYTLIVADTGTGKGFPLDIAQALLPPDYSIDTGVQSGEGLLGIIAEEIPPTKKKERLTYKAIPALLLLPEWSALAKAATIENSRLIELLNNIFQQEKPYTLSRSNRLSSGGKIRIPNPMLSIFGPTNPEAYAKAVRRNSELVTTGLINRFFTLPGLEKRWKDCELDRASIDMAALRDLTRPLVARAWQPQGALWTLYAPDALERRKKWGEDTAEIIMNERSPRRDFLARLHFYAHHIALTSAWAEGTPQILLPHVEAALAAVTASQTFVEKLLLSDLTVVCDDPDIPRHKAYEINLELKVMAYVKANPGTTRRIVGQQLGGKKATTADVGATIGKLVSGKQLSEILGGGNNPSRKLYLPENAPKKKRGAN